MSSTMKFPMTGNQVDGRQEYGKHTVSVRGAVVVIIAVVQIIVC